MHETPGFLTTKRWISGHYAGKKHLSMSTFYILQRKKLGLLVDSSNKPMGGKWSFNAVARKMTKPSAGAIHLFKKSPIEMEAVHYTDANYFENYGSAEDFWFPTTHQQARVWLESFIQNRLEFYAEYQEALAQKDIVMMHSVLAASLNIGLLTPREVLDAVLEYHEKHPIPVEALEAFIRQLAGWREYVRTAYVVAGVRQRRSNFWKHRRRMPKSFYEGTTGIYPVDLSIKKLLHTSYANHNERLRLIGVFMMLCEFHPEDVYRWFMEMFIDSYDWAVVPNVYGLSQYADGGKMTAAPFLTNSRYLLKVSDYPKGEWCAVWDGLYWRFLSEHEAYLSGLPRFNEAMERMRRMGKNKLSEHSAVAKRFLDRLG